MQRTLLVLAAGLGSRYGGLKQLDAMGPHGERILDYSVYDARRAGFTEVVFVIRKDFEAAFREQVLPAFSPFMEARTLCQEPDDLPAGIAAPAAERRKPWGTGHAVWVARTAVRSPFAVINADDFYGRPAIAALGGALSELPSIERETGIAQGILAAYRLADTLSEGGSVSRGICAVGPDRRLETIDECHEIRRDPDSGNIVAGGSARLLGDDTPASMNFFGFTPAIFPLLEARFARFLETTTDSASGEFYLPAAVGECIDAGELEVTVQRVRSPWLGITYPADKPNVQAALREMISEGSYPSSLWEGANPSRS